MKLQIKEKYKKFLICEIVLVVAVFILPTQVFAWTPTQEDQMYIQLQGKQKTVPWATIYDVDLFDTDASKIASLHKARKKVVCYFSAGTYEDWRSDAGRFNAGDIGTGLEDWEGESWLDLRSMKVREVMKKRLDLAVTKGCDGVDPDNVDGNLQDSGFPLSYNDSRVFNEFLAREAHTRGLAIGLKNNMDQLHDLKSVFDFAINEQCHQYAECATYTQFVALKKPVFNLEYKKQYLSKNSKTFKKLCTQSKKLGITTVAYPLDLDGSVYKRCP